jgi:hypothetical protein
LDSNPHYTNLKKLRTLRNRVLKRKYIPKKKSTGGWREPQTEEVHNLYSPPIIIKIIKSRRFRLAGHVRCTEEMKCAYNFLAGNMNGINRLEDLGVDGRQYVYLAL